MTDQEFLKKVLIDSKLRSELTHTSHQYFMGVYFHSYIKYSSASMHKEMFALTEDKTNPLTVIVAFRGSAKSTIFAFSYPIWAICGVLQKKFVIIVSQTQAQARQKLENIKSELEHNGLLVQDHGTFKEDAKWDASTIVIPKYGARIMVVSTDQSIRGILNKQYRPDLIICDDIEDIQSTKTLEGREKTFTWFSNDLLQAGDLYTQVVVIGNLVHRDCLIMRLKERIEAGHMRGVFKRYPLLDEQGICLWLGKFPDEQSIADLRSRIPSDHTWFQEYQLQIVAGDTDIVTEDMINFYDCLPTKTGLGPRHTCIQSADLAISLEERADYTAIVALLVVGNATDLMYYVLPDMVNRRMEFHDICSVVKQRDIILKNTHNTKSVITVIEDVGFQRAAIQDLSKEISVEAFRPKGDKATRLALITPYLKSGRILFPRTGAEELIEQMLGFGHEKHDDLVDALTAGILVFVDGQITVPKKAILV